jgi:hypothetical protein
MTEASISSRDDAFPLFQRVASGLLPAYYLRHQSLTGTARASEYPRHRLTGTARASGSILGHPCWGHTALGAIPESKFWGLSCYPRYAYRDRLLWVFDLPVGEKGVGLRLFGPGVQLLLAAIPVWILWVATGSYSFDPHPPRNGDSAVGVERGRY